MRLWWRSLSRPDRVAILGLVVATPGSTCPGWCGKAMSCTAAADRIGAYHQTSLQATAGASQQPSTQPGHDPSVGGTCRSR
jgi:hypothetical protein